MSSRFAQSVDRLSAGRAYEAARRLMAAGRPQAALAEVKRACGFDPKALPLWLLRADVARAGGDFGDLAESLGVAARLTDRPLERAHFSVERGWALYRVGRRADALAACRGLGAAPPIEVRRSLGALLDALNRTDEALPHLRGAAAASPTNPGDLTNLALAYQALGDLESAAATLQQALAHAPYDVNANAIMADLRRWTEADDPVERLELARAAASTPVDRARLDYALFKVLDDLGRTEAAWTALQRGSEMMRAATGWSAPAQALTMARLSAIQPKTPQPLAPPEDIFILGLPRSGTTLVDRILAAHSAVASLGENDLFALLAAPGASTAGLYVDAAAALRMESADWPSIGEAYRREVRALTDGAGVRVNKMTQNWMLAGAIAAALPRARFVHLRRAPMDTLFGAWRQAFRGDFGWSYAAEDLAAHYAQYLQTTRGWAETLGSRWIEVSYESLVSDPAREIPALLTACGLDFEPQCLTPETTAGVVRTLSAAQVRSPISTAGIGSWRRYQHQLKPLQRSLEARGLLD